MTEMGKNNTTQVNSERQGLKSLFERTYRMRYWILACMAVFVLAVFISMRFVTYRFERTIVLKVDMSAYDLMSDSLMDAQGVKQEFVRDRMESKVMLLQSMPVVNQAIQLMAENQKSKQETSVELYSRNKANLTAQYSKFSDVIQLTFNSSDTTQADAFLMALVESYNLRTAQVFPEEHAFITVIDPPKGNSTPVYPHSKALYLLAVLSAIFIPLVGCELKDWWRQSHSSEKIF